MTCHVERYKDEELPEGKMPGAVKQMTFTCDEPGCEVRSPPDADIIAAGGLTKMGWFFGGKVHYCPAHAAPHIEAKEARERELLEKANQ